MGNYNHGFSGRNDRGMDPMWKAALGVAIVAVGVYVGNILYTKYLIHKASTFLKEATSEMQASMQAAAERGRQHQLALEQERTRQKQLELDFQREQMERQVALQDAARIKEKAWEKFYKKPAKCESLSKQGDLVECGNYYIKEKNRFEEIWANRKPM
jgi:hypothetical protein